MLTRGVVHLAEPLPRRDHEALLQAVRAHLDLDAAAPLRLDYECAARDRTDPAAPMLQIGIAVPTAQLTARARRRIEPDPLIGPADLWTPYAAGGGLFGDRARAHAAMGAEEVAEPGLGAGINVAILDYGIDQGWLQQWRRAAFGARSAAAEKLAGWPRFVPIGRGRRIWINPGDAPPDGLTHGHMIARNVLSIAPAARIWDVPLLPDTMLGPPSISLARAILLRMLRHIRRGHKMARGEKQSLAGRWILVNAWGAFDPLHLDPPGTPDEPAYWNDAQHRFNRDMLAFEEAGIDMVFAAGNCGEPGAHPRCGETSIGPGRSITGVNAHPAVLTVGAVRSDGLPIGPSAQAPGALAGLWAKRLGEGKETGLPMTLQARLEPEADDPRAKPDLCAPSHFHDEWSADRANTGSSAACGLVGGALAALRGLERAQGKPPRSPGELRAVLRRTARRPPGAGHDPRLGWGIVDLAAARHALGL
ncbi:S8 family serine peptidase [Falsiroseomonas sp.]|uniref:S8 family serine peptidase n=1 Tax=Falsiroseomonas sp. TaxID=2870721 RepID=UPI003F71E1C9